MATKAEHITAAETALARAEQYKDTARWTHRDDLAAAAVRAALAQVTT